MLGLRKRKVQQCPRRHKLFRVQVVSAQCLLRTQYLLRTRCYHLPCVPIVNQHPSSLPTLSFFCTLSPCVSSLLSCLLLSCTPVVSSPPLSLHPCGLLQMPVVSDTDGRPKQLRALLHVLPLHPSLGHRPAVLSPAVLRGLCSGILSPRPWRTAGQEKRERHVLIRPGWR